MLWRLGSPRVIFAARSPKPHDAPDLTVTGN
jgi:hypothetical protein